MSTTFPSGISRRALRAFAGLGGASTLVHVPMGTAWWQEASSTREHVTSLLTTAESLPPMHGECVQHSWSVSSL